MNENEEKIEEVAAPPPVEEEDFKDKYFRLLAEMENSRKRLQKEKHEMTRFAIENVISEVLTPIDTFESALGFTDQMNEETRNWAKGFGMILSQFKEILSNHNIVSFHSVGEMFDPHHHEAVEVEETDDHPEGTILKEFLKGYKSGDRIIRAARVKVARKKSENKE
ncbi:MAG: nucleotide exchange factor GrpE [Verrucomicrobia bacterium]|nr:nucleotide exchange factor GrpE [Verrucomicrobiota bacterium]